MTFPIRHDWQPSEVAQLLDMPFMDLIFEAQKAHRSQFDANEIQQSTLLSIKTGGCPEDCNYCSQSAHHDTGLNATKLMEVDNVIAEARKAAHSGATRYCMGAAWRSPKDRDMDALCQMVKEVKALGLETCMTLGMLSKNQVGRLKEAGLDYYNHNLDTSEEHYGNIISTRTFEDRLETLEHVRDAGIHVCCGGILGLGETDEDRVSFLISLANLPKHPESVPINMLIPIEGTPSSDNSPVDSIDFVRVIAAARIMMPRSMVRLSAGREDMSDELQALCFLAGANSIFVGDQLLTADNPLRSKDAELFGKLGLRTMPLEAKAAE